MPSLTFALKRSCFCFLFGLIVQDGFPVVAATLPPGFVETKIAGELNPTTMNFAPDGRLFLCEKQGLLRIVVHEQMLAQPGLDISKQIDGWNERGLLSVCFDPDFAGNGWIYVYYTHLRNPEDASHSSSNNRVSRFTVKGDAADPASERVILEIDNLSKIGWHNGGGLAFGKDGKLYVSTGENTVGPNAQNPGNLLGKLLRINKDGSIPADNPNYATFQGNNRAIVALGLRNAFAIDVQPGSGLLYLSMVGANFEQIERYDSSATPEAVNYGWPDIDGPPRQQKLPPGYRAPEYAYDHGKGKGVALCSGDFYNPAKPGSGAFPSSFTGKYFFSDYGGWIKFMDPANPQERQDFAEKINRPIDVATAPDGALWYIERAGIPGGSDAANSASTNGALWRITWNGVVQPPAQASTGPPNPGPPGKPMDLVNGIARPEITPAGGNFTGPVWVRITTGTADAIIHYTTDGKVPDMTCPVYTAPFELTTNTKIKVLATKAGSSEGALAQAEINIRGHTPYGMDTRPPVTGIKLPAKAEGPLPATLLATGIFTDQNLTPKPGVIPYSLTSTVWADSAKVRRWVVLPPDGKIGFAPAGEYKWPGGTILVQHFDIEKPAQTESWRRLETRLLVLDETGAFGYGASYRWREDGSDADLVDESGKEEVLKTITTSGASRDQTWSYPSRALCYLCHTPNAGFVLGPKTHQLGGTHAYSKERSDQQLRTWNYLQMFTQQLDETTFANVMHTVKIDDPTASLELRVRSYLDVNCAQCHRPAGTGAVWDARFGTELAKQEILDGVVRNNLGIEGAKIIVAGDVAKSIMHQRLASTIPVIQMPMFTRNVPDEQALKVLEQWIQSLPAAAAVAPAK